MPGVWLDDQKMWGLRMWAWVTLGAWVTLEAWVTSWLWVTFGAWVTLWAWVTKLERELPKSINFAMLMEDLSLK